MPSVNFVPSPFTRRKHLRTVFVPAVAAVLTTFAGGSTAMVLASAVTLPGTVTGCPPGSKPSGQRCSVIFAYSGSPRTFVVPPGTRSLAVVVDGAGGGWGQGVMGAGQTPHVGNSFGGQESGTLGVRPGEVLTVVVGGAGENGNPKTGVGGGPAYGGGGEGGAGGGGGGGGGSFVFGPSGKLLIAAGGGGGRRRRERQR